MSDLHIEIKRLPHAADLPLPVYATALAAGMDLCAAVDKDVVIAPGDRAAIPTGYMIALPDGYEAQVRPRSGLALKHGITLPNSPGTIANPNQHHRNKPEPSHNLSLNSS